MTTVFLILVIAFASLIAVNTANRLAIVGFCLTSGCWLIYTSFTGPLEPLWFWALLVTGALEIVLAIAIVIVMRLAKKTLSPH
jgi:hypothetical protein